MGCLYKHVCLKIELCLKMWFSNALWYNVIRWSTHICKKSSFLSFNSFLVKFAESYRGSERAKLKMCDKAELGEKYHYASDIHFEWPCLVCYFIAILFYIERKWLLITNLATILPLKSKLSEKFQRFNVIDGNIEMLKNSWISKNFN